MIFPRAMFCVTHDGVYAVDIPQDTFIFDKVLFRRVRVYSNRVVLGRGDTRYEWRGDSTAIPVDDDQTLTLRLIKKIGTSK